MVGDRSETDQKAFVALLSNLFHWRLDKTDKRAYSLDPKDYPNLPLFVLTKDQNYYLNQVFWLVYDDLSSWPSMSFYHRTSVEDVEALAKSEYSAIAESPSGRALHAVPKISKLLVAYLQGLVAVSPYFRGTADPRAAGFAEEVAVQTFDRLNKVTKKDYMDFLQRKLGEWYRGAPKAAVPKTAVRTEHDDPAPQASGGSEEVPDGVSSEEVALAMD